MIPYTLAKEMKENGYPMRRTCECVQDICVHQNYPTIEEVIEALGDKFEWLGLYPATLYGYTKSEYFNKNKWVCGTWENGVPGEGDYFIEKSSGPTPIIAACNLWLVVNRK